MKNSIKLKYALLCIIAIISCMSCSDTSMSSNDIQGTWKGIRTYVNPVGGRKYVYLTMEFGEDKIGTLEYITPTFIGEGIFDYNVSGKTINCRGAYANTNGEVDEDFSISFKTEGDRLITDDFLGCFILTRDGSVITNVDGTEFTEEDLTPSNVTDPVFEKYLTISEYDGFTIKLRFKNGGDIRENMSCTVYWRAYAKKPSTTPTEGDMTNCEDMRIVDHNDVTGKTVFEKSHVGFNGGSYIYYYAICKNSKGSSKADLTYTIIPRL